MRWNLWTAAIHVASVLTRIGTPPPIDQDVLSRPTAKYLQQHRFVSTDKAEALRALQPLIQNTRTYMAELAAASDGQTGGSGVDRGG